MQAIRFTQIGGPEVLGWMTVENISPKPGEVQIRVAAAGVNFLDTLVRSGALPLSTSASWGLGVECAGEIVALGEDVLGLALGDRVGCGTGPLGAYAEYYNVPATRVAKLPDKISYETAGAAMMKGLTADYLLNRVARVGNTTTLLVHAAAGGVGSIICQWAKHLGAKVVGIVGSPEKVKKAEALGCDLVINANEVNIQSAVMEFTQGKGVDAVFDSVGQDVFSQSLASLGQFGAYISYGTASGPLPEISLAMLHPKCLWFTSTNVYTYTESAAEHAAGIKRLFQMIEQGVLQIDIGLELPLAEAALAHSLLEQRKTTGSIILRP